MDNNTALPEFERYLQRRYPERSTAKHYLSDITGVTDLAILRAIVAGERNPVKLAQFRNPTCKSSEDDIAKALTGSWRAEHLFVLKQALELFDFYTQQAAACDAELERQFSAVKYHAIGAMAYDQKQQERELAYLKKKAAKLGFTLTAHELALAAV